MCGIIGFIGHSKDPEATWELANALLIKTEVRGSDATGFYACEKGQGVIFYDKEPVKSSIYSNREIWRKQFSQTDSDMLIGHCRASSVGVGHERFNKNNHPHVSLDRRVALVHNGRIPEYNSLKNKYKTIGDCDSEILLRMFESSDDFADNEAHLKELFPKLPPIVAHRLLGLKEIFSRVNYGAMAVAIAERGDDGSRSLWLFRDEDRPLTVIDLRKTLGQIFFCSTDLIFQNAVESCSANTKKYISATQEVIGFPPHHIWRFGQDADGKIDIRKFKITKTKSYGDWKSDETDEPVRPLARRDNAPPSGVVSRLKDDEEVAEEPVVTSSSADTDTGDVTDEKKKTLEPAVTSSPSASTETTTTGSESTPGYGSRWPAVSPSTTVAPKVGRTIYPPGEKDFPEYDMAQFDSLMKEIEDKLSQVETGVANNAGEKNFTEHEFTVILQTLKSLSADLDGALVYVNK